jgi:Domain of unknown function (DUF4397)
MPGISRARLLATGALMAIWGCSDDHVDTEPTGSTGSLRVVHAAESAAALDVLVDGGVVITGLAAGTVSSAVPLSAGQRTIAVRPSGEAASPVLAHVSIGADSEYTAIVIDSSAVLNPIVVTDTGGVPAPGKTKLQVANFASALGPIDVYRRQPDFEGLVDLVFPFTYRTLSGYVQSDPGDWQVLIAPETRVAGVPPDEPKDTLLIVDPITLAAGQAATVVIVDKAGGGADAVVVSER